MNFVFGSILLASAAAATPVIIHLLMKPRPRKQELPTLRFVRRSHRASLGRMRMRHVLLMALRMGLIVLLAMLLARPFLPGHTRADVAEVPSAVAVVIDTSSSMRASRQQRSALQRGQYAAARIVEGLPEGSRVLVLPTSGDPAGAGFLSRLELAAQHVTDTPATYADTPVAVTLAQAYRALDEVNLDSREIVLVTDATEQAFRALSPTGEDEVFVTVIDAGLDRPRNVSVAPVSPSAAVAPLGSEITLRSALRSENVTGEVQLEVRLDGEAVHRESFRVNDGEQTGLHLPIRPDRRGIVHGQLALRTRDDLDADDVQYFTLRIEAPATLLVVTSSPSDRNAAGFLMANAAAPPQPPGEAGLSRRLIRPEQLTEKSLDDVQLVLLADAAALDERQFRALETFCRRGGAVWFVPGSAVTAEAYNTPAAQRIMPVRLGPLRQLEEPVGFRLTHGDHPLFDPFEDPQNPSLAEVRCRRRYELASVAPDSQMVLSYADGTSAILTREVGRGQVVFWNFSPPRAWSNLGVLANRLIVLAQRTAELLLRGRDLPPSVTWGQQVRLELPSGMDSPVATLRTPAARTSRPVEPDLRERSLHIDADQLGGYTVFFREGEREVLRGFSVNVPATESRLHRVPREQIMSYFPAGAVEVITPGQRRRSREVTRRLDLLSPVMALLLVVLVAEGFLGNRFYRRGNADVTGREISR